MLFPADIAQAVGSGQGKIPGLPVNSEITAQQITIIGHTNGRAGGIIGKAIEMRLCPNRLPQRVKILKQCAGRTGSISFGCIKKETGISFSYSLYPGQQISAELRHIASES